MASTRQLYGITLEAEVDGEPLDITTYLTNLRVVKSLRTLVPMIGITLSPTVHGILKNGITAYTKLHIKLDKMKERTDTMIPELSLIDTYVYPAQFTFAPALVESDSGNPQNVRAPLSFVTIPEFFTALYAQNICKIVGTDEPIELQKVVEEHLIADAFENGLVKLQVKKNINDFKNKQKLVRHLIHKTSFVDYLRYLSQRYGFYEGGTLFYTDFGYVDLETGNQYDCIINLFNTKELEDPKYRLVFKSTNKEVESSGDIDTYLVYNVFTESDNRVDALLKLRTDLYWQYFGRDSFFLNLKEPKPLKETSGLINSGQATASESKYFAKDVIPIEHVDMPYLDNQSAMEAGEGLSNAANALQAQSTLPFGMGTVFQQLANQLNAASARVTAVNPPPDEIRRFKTMTTTQDNDFFYKTYISDRFLDSRNLRISLDQFFPVELINPAKLVKFECQDGLYTERYNGTYMIADCDFQFTRAVGAQDTWTVLPALTLTRGFAQSEK